MSRAFVAGATGYTGREVVRALVARGIEAVAHVRPQSRDLAAIVGQFASEGALVDETPWEEESFRTTLLVHRPDAVFALLGTTRARAAAARRAGAPRESYDSVDYELTAMLLRASVACASRPRFVYLSALGAGRPSSNAYLSARYKAESDVRVSGLAYVIARPSFITGSDRAEARPMERVADAVLGVAGRVGAAAARDKYASMTAGELSRALVALAFDESTPSLVVEAAELRARAALPGQKAAPA
ncbi:MAG TPA: NAD(P)H-binding protein [Polyangiaceae bacterium]|nr:NAD(P)H-binding protein [Polyangiaceae bacterium]